MRIQRMAESLAARGHVVHAVTYHVGEGEPAPGVTVHRTPALATYRKVAPGPSYQKLLVVNPLLVAVLRKVLRRYAIDVIHAHHYEGLLVSALARMGTAVPLVYDAHTLLVSELPYYSLGLPAHFKVALGRGMDRWVPRLADHVISITDKIRENLEHHSKIAASRITVIPNGVEIEQFASEPPTSDRKNGPKKVIFTGNLAPYQGIDLLLRAFGEVVRTHPDVRLVLGTDSSFAAYERLAADLGVRGSIDVVPMPRFEDLPAFLADADLAVNPRTECDGMPLKLLNYMAASRPVVSFAAAASGVRHMETGWLAENGNVQAFARGMATLLDDSELAAQMGRRARRLIETEYRWPVMAERIEAVYGRVIGGVP